MRPGVVVRSSLIDVLVAVEAAKKAVKAKIGAQRPKGLGGEAAVPDADPFAWHPWVARARRPDPAGANSCTPNALRVTWHEFMLGTQPFTHKLTAVPHSQPPAPLHAATSRRLEVEAVPPHQRLVTGEVGSLSSNGSRRTYSLERAATATGRRRLGLL